MEEVLECPVQNVRTPGFTSETATNHSFLRPMEYPTVQKRVRGCVERRMPRSPRCSQGHKGLLYE